MIVMNLEAAVHVYQPHVADEEGRSSQAFAHGLRKHTGTATRALSTFYFKPGPEE